MSIQNRPAPTTAPRAPVQSSQTGASQGARPSENVRAGQSIPAGTQTESVRAGHTVPTAAQFVQAGSVAFHESRAGAQAGADAARGAQGATERRETARSSEIQGFAAVSGPRLTGYSQTVATGVGRGQTVGSYLGSEAVRGTDQNRGIPDGQIATIRPGDRPQGVYARNNYSDLRIDRTSQFTQQSKMYFVSGITSGADMRVNDGLILANMTRKPVQVVHNNTNGAVADAAETAMQVMGGRTNAPTQSMARALTADLTTLMNGQSLPGGDRNLSITAHSQGGVIATHALSTAIDNLRNEKTPSGQRRWSDDQIRNVVSQRVQLNLLGSPSNPSETNPSRGQPINFVPPTLTPGTNEKPLSWFFGGPNNVAVISTSTNTPAAIPSGAGINTLRHRRDPVPMNLQDMGRDDAAMFQQLQRGMTRPVNNPGDAAANVADVSLAMARIYAVAGSDILGAIRDLRHPSFHDLSGANREGQFDRQRYNDSYFGRSRPAFSGS